MDRHRAPARRLRVVALLVAGIGLMAASGAGEPPLRALRWNDPDMAVAALTRQPPECLEPALEGRRRAAAEVGRAAFRTPLLLGGQAARLGLSCESCHSNGRVNRAFRFPGLSGAPGTADVTASLMSSHRGNDLFDPRPIPDLAAPGKIGRAEGDPALRAFIRGLIVEEFDGQEPAPVVLDGLVAYVRAIDVRHCPSAEAVPVTAEAEVDSALRAATAARERWVAGDGAGARLMLAAARSALGRLDERFAAIPADHARLLKADEELHAIRLAVETGGEGIDGRLAHWIEQGPELSAPLLRDASGSLYDEDVLAKAAAPR